MKEYFSQLRNNLKAKKNQAMRVNLNKMPRVSQGKTANLRSEVEFLEAIAEDVMNEIDKSSKERISEGGKLCY